MQKIKPHGLRCGPCGVLFTELRMGLIGFPKCFQFYDAGLVSYSPGHDLFGMFAVIRLDDRPATMRTVMAAPFKMMKVACRVDFFNNGVALAGLMRGFDKITVHKTSPQ